MLAEYTENVEDDEDLPPIADPPPTPDVPLVLENPYRLLDAVAVSQKLADFYPSDNKVFTVPQLSAFDRRNGITPNGCGCCRGTMRAADIVLRCVGMLEGRRCTQKAHSTCVKKAVYICCKGNCSTLQAPVETVEVIHLHFMNEYRKVAVANLKEAVRGKRYHSLLVSYRNLMSYLGSAKQGVVATNVNPAPKLARLSGVSNGSRGSASFGNGSLSDACSTVENSFLHSHSFDDGRMDLTGPSVHVGPTNVSTYSEDTSEESD